VLGGEATWEEPARAVLERHEPVVRHFLTEQDVQTNEVQRSWMLVPCFLAAARRSGADALDIVELGPSAGLNLLWDRYRCEYAHGACGPIDAPLVLTGEERAPVPADVLMQRPRVASRIGLDLAPLDASTEEGVRLLRSFVWPGQDWRLAQLDRALGVLREDPPELVRGDVLEDLARVLAQRPHNGLLLVYATNVLDYVGVDGRARVFSVLEDAARDRAIALVANAPVQDGAVDHQALALRVYPGGEPETLALADFHGAWIDWRA
jgi:hypothetical protein